MKNRFTFRPVWLCILALLTAENSVLSAEPSGNEDPIPVSLIELIANKDMFHGKFVRVRGYLHLEFEGNGLYLSKDDYRYGVTKNGLWVGFSKPLLEQQNLKKLSDKWVTLEGYFDKNHKGHLGMWSGTIDSIVKARKL